MPVTDPRISPWYGNPPGRLKWSWATNAYSMGNQQEDLEVTILLGSYNLIAVTEPWWDKSCD